MSATLIPFNRANLEGNERKYLDEVLSARNISGDGAFTKRCHALLENTTRSQKALLTHSCTAALEMMALLIQLGPGDEVIMPSFTFTSTANAVALRGAVPVFVDVRPDTMNIDETKIAEAITTKTKAIFVVHYAGVACEMDAIMAIANQHRLFVLEDAAQGLMATYRDQPLGSIGDLGALSFHETKNVVSGEGGALLINRSGWLERAEIIREKGTDRSRFLRGQIDKYTWADLGSSYLPSELIAAVLLAQLERAELLTEQRRELWHRYHQGFAELEAKGAVTRQSVPSHCKTNGHIFFLFFNSLDERTRVIAQLKAKGMQLAFHYVPLHSSPAGLRLGRASGSLSLTSNLADRLVRLPLWSGMSPSQADMVIDEIKNCIDRHLAN